MNGVTARAETAMASGAAQQQPGPITFAPTYHIDARYAQKGVGEEIDSKMRQAFKEFAGQVPKIVQDARARGSRI
jgi:hypothetical protein